MGCRRQGLGRARVEGSAARSVRGRGGKGPAGTRPKGPQGRHSLPRLLPTCSRFPLTCPRGQWSSLLAQRLARFRPSDPTVMCTGASRTTASRLFASGARARRTLRTPDFAHGRSGPTALWRPGARVIRHRPGVCCRCRFHPVVCGAGDRAVSTRVLPCGKNRALPLPEPRGGLPTTSTHLCPPPHPGRELITAGPRMPLTKRTPWRRQ